MSFNTQQLNSALADPSIAALSDADAAAALSAPILTPVAGAVTVTTLAATWGFPKLVAALASFQAVAASGGANGAEASALLAILNGPGFSASNPQVPGLIPVFVGFANGAITTQDATDALFTTSYRCGDVVQPSDVTSARAALAFQASVAAAQGQLNTFAAAGNGILAALSQAGSGTVPTLPQLIQQMVAATPGGS